MSLPSLVLIGIFCKFGLDDDRRPVEVSACEKFVWTRPVTPSIKFGRVSVYVVFSLLSWRHSIISSAILCPATARSSKISIPVAHVPLFVFFPPPRLRFSKSISPSCFGLAILNSVPANLYIFCSIFFIFSPNFT